MAIGVPSESPAIVVKEVDLTGGVPNVQSTTGAFAGAFRWGPCEQAILVDNESTLASTFGSPNDSFAVDFLTAANFLRYSNSLQVSRAVDSAARNAVNDADSGASATASLIKNDEAWDSGTHTGIVFAKYPGTFGNSLKVEMIDSGKWAADSALAGNFAAHFDGAPTGSDERHVLVTDEDGVITGTAGTVLERYPFVSSTSTAVNADGSSNYEKEVINRSSNYIRMNGVISSSGTKNGAYSLTSGNNGAAVSAGDIQTALDVFNDKDIISLDFMIAPGMSTNAAQKAIVNDMVATAGTTRKDCVVVSSPARESVVNQSTPVSTTVTDTSDYTYSSYLFVDNNWLKVYDKYNDKFIHIPAASSTAGIMAASDADTAPWFSPAGSRRGAYLGVTGLAHTPTKAERDTLYKAGINPIANLPGQGILLYGDKTHLNRPSAFDRINVRRLFNVVERAVALAARNTLFELNDEFTRAEFVNIVEPFLREIKGRRGITDFRVVCDETNNTAAIIDRNEFVASLFIKPARSINYITLNFVAVRSGVDFEEVAGLQV
jgi:phage tail sheath protein FI